MAIRIAVSCLAWLALFGSAEANIFFVGQNETAAAFFGSSTAENTTTTRCDPVNTGVELQRVPVGIFIHARNDFFFGPLVSGINLICERMNDALSRSDPVTIARAGRVDDGTLVGTPYSRRCPTGHVLSGLTGRAGWLVEAVTVRCARVSYANLAENNIIDSGQVSTIGTALFGDGGSAASSNCPVNQFVRSIRVDFDSNFVTRMRVNCQSLRSGRDLTQGLDLGVATRDQAVVFNGMVSDGFSVSVLNFGRDTANGEATVRLTFTSNVVTITTPDSCVAQQVSDTTRRILCPVPALSTGGRALISGFVITPLVVGTFGQAGSLSVLADDDVEPANDGSTISILVPGIFW
jgi:hypothetical protein